MPLFASLYERVMSWAAHKHAQWYLVGLSFAESSFFPIPPDVMLAPMSLAQPKRALRYALMTTLASVVGGAAGYLIGMFAFEMVQPMLEKAGYMGRYQMAMEWFSNWGVWVVFIAGFSPIPYKLFTIAAGAISMAFLPFMIASLVGRGARFFIVAGLMMWGGDKMEHMLRKYIDRIGWAVIAIIAVLFIVIKYN